MREEFSPEEFLEKEDDPVPFRALALSILALIVPVLGATLAPEILDEEQGLLVWLVALVPPFLLTYYRGWRGASVGLAAGMAALTATHLILVVTRAGLPNFVLLLWVVTTYIGVCVGAGVLAELLRRERKAAETMALTDALTGLPNRRHANVFLDAAFAAATRGQPVTVILFDLDRFKAVNDRYGHPAGDSVIQRVGTLLSGVTRRMDLSARWGGEEFITILTRSGAAGAVVFAERVLRELASEGFPWGTVTLSAGIAEYEPGMGSPELLVAAADRALYSAKEEGRNRARVAPRESEGEVTASGGVAKALQAAVPGVGPELYPAHYRGIQLRSGADAPIFLPPGVGGEAERISPDLPIGRERILVVDDNAYARRAVSRILERLGYQVVQAGDGDSALTAIREDPEVDLIITDLIMPGMSGFTLVDRIEWEIGPRRVLYMSGFVQGDFSWNGAPGALVSFLAKPMTANVLANQVRALLDLEPQLPAGKVS